jgi:hypothetical protein
MVPPTHNEFGRETRWRPRQIFSRWVFKGVSGRREAVSRGGRAADEENDGENPQFLNDTGSPALHEVVDYIVRREALQKRVEGLFPAVYNFYEQRYLLVLDV